MLKIAPIPAGEEVSRDFNITVNGQALPLYTARVSAMPYNTVWPGMQRPLDQTEIAPFAVMETDETLRFQLTSARDFDSVTVRPLSAEIRPAIRERQIEFSIARPGAYTVELDGFHNALTLFVNPPADFGAAPSDPNVIYFGPGVYHTGPIYLKSHETLFIDAGAVVYGSAIAVDTEDTHVVGYGILDGSDEKRSSEDCLLPYCYDGAFPEDTQGLLDYMEKQRDLNGLIRFYRCRDVSARGVILRDSSTFGLIPANCDRVWVDNIKTIGMWRYNSDGIDVFNCSDCLIENSFFRDFDDCIVIKGICGWDHRNNERIHVRHCTVWCDWGRALEIGAETNAPEYRDILFEDCDLIHGCHLYMDIQHHNYADIHDITFRNIRCEYNRHQQAAVYQHDMNAPYDETLAGTHPIAMGAYVFNTGLFSPADRYRNGKIHDILFEDIRILSEPGLDLPRNSFAGLDEEHNVRDIRIRGLYRNGKRITGSAEAVIEAGPAADGITLD